MAGRVISAVLTLRDRNFSSGLRDASGQLTDFGRQFQRVENRVNSFQKSAVSAFSTVAKSAAGLAAAGITGIGVAAAKTVVEMDSAFSTLSAKTGATGYELEELSAIAKEVYKQGFGESISQAADDVATLNSMFSDLDYGEVQTIAEGAYTISELWGQEVKDVGKTISTMTKTFDGLGHNEALDLITTAFQQTGDASGDLLDTFNEYSTQFKALGYDAEGFTATLIAGAKSGAFNFDKLADTAKEGFLKMAEGSDDTKSALSAMGLDANQVISDIGAGGADAQQAFMAVSSALASIEDPAKRNQLAIAAFGTPLEDLGPQFATFFGSVNQDLGNFEGATQNAADAMHNNFGSRMTQVWRELKIGMAEAFNSAGGKELLDAIATKAEELVPKIQGMVDKAIEFGNSVRDHWGTISTILASAGAAVGAFVLVMGTMKVISGISALINGFRTAMALATAGQWAMNAAMLASPWTWVAVAIAAVVAIGVALYMNWDTVKAKAGELWDKVKEVFGAIYDWGAEKIQGVTGFFSGLYDTVSNFISKITNFKMPDWLSSIGSTIGGAVSAVGNFINGSHATGLNRVPFDGYIAELHKDEMVIPARQAERLRQQGANINNIDQMPRNNNTQSSTPVMKTTTTNNPNGGATVIIQNLNAKGITAAEVVNEFVPLVKMRLANM